MLLYAATTTRCPALAAKLCLDRSLVRRVYNKTCVVYTTGNQIQVLHCACRRKRIERSERARLRSHTHTLQNNINSFGSSLSRSLFECLQTAHGPSTSFSHLVVFTVFQNEFSNSFDCRVL